MARGDIYMIRKLAKRVRGRDKTALCTQIRVGFAKGLGIDVMNTEALWITFERGSNNVDLNVDYSFNASEENGTPENIEQLERHVAQAFLEFARKYKLRHFSLTLKDLQNGRFTMVELNSEGNVTAVRGTNQRILEEPKPQAIAA